MMGLMGWGCKRRDLRVEAFSPPVPIVQGVGFPSEPFNWLGANYAESIQKHGRIHFSAPLNSMAPAKTHGTILHNTNKHFPSLARLREA